MRDRESPGVHVFKEPAIPCLHSTVLLFGIVLQSIRQLNQPPHRVEISRLMENRLPNPFYLLSTGQRPPGVTNPRVAWIQVAGGAV